MQYILLIYGNESDQANIPEAERPKMFAEWMAYTKAMKDADVYVAGDALQPTPTAASLRIRAGERMVTDGPFAETTEQLGGYYLINVADKDGALEWAAKCPGASHGTIEVRPVMVFD